MRIKKFIHTQIYKSTSLLCVARNIVRNSLSVLYDRDLLITNRIRKAGDMARVLSRYRMLVPVKFGADYCLTATINGSIRGAFT